MWLKDNPIRCDCYACNPIRGQLHRATKAWLLKTYGPPVYDWEDLERQAKRSTPCTRVSVVIPM